MEAWEEVSYTNCVPLVVTVSVQQIIFFPTLSSVTGYEVN